MLPFEPKRDAALRRADTVDPARYAATRNALDGAVTGLSPWITHGIVTLPEVVARIEAREALPAQHRLRMEFGWREFFQHCAWQHGDAILQDLRGPPPWPGRYQPQLPADLREGRTGVPAIDAAVRQLYATGYLHNHARLWLSSYAVHLRKVAWRAGADWMWAHLLDGDLASNHLSWQWVAGTFSAKPYLFNAENVARFAPPAWHSPGTAIDRSYEALEVWARTGGDAGPEPGAPGTGVPEPARSADPLSITTIARFADAPDPTAWAGRAVVLVHPWAIRRRQPDAFHLGVLHMPAHSAWPWSARRWQFVAQAMGAVCDACIATDLTWPQWQRRDLAVATGVQAEASPFPGYRDALAATGATLTAPPRLLQWPAAPCRSFSRFWALAHGR